MLNDGLMVINDGLMMINDGLVVINDGWWWLAMINDVIHNDMGVSIVMGVPQNWRVYSGQFQKKWMMS